jgi:methanogenic corrinoid protein MtbC1
MNQDTLEAIARAVVQGSEEKTVYLCEQGLRAGISAQELLNAGLCSGMQEVGELYDRKEYFLPEMLLSAQAMRSGVDALRPAIKTTGEAASGETVVLGVVEGDVHEIGKNLVAIMLEAAGYLVIDLGTNVPAAEFVNRVIQSGADVLALSTMMTTTIPSMRATVELARELESRPSIVVGGAPLSPAIAEDMGADGYGENAARAASLVRTILRERQ